MEEKEGGEIVYNTKGKELHSIREWIVKESELNLNKFNERGAEKTKK